MTVDQPTAGDALAQLDRLVGEWTLEVAMPGIELPQGVEARASFAWHESGAHLVERSTVDLPEAPDGWKIVGCDAANGTYFQLYADDRGVSRVYEMTIDASGWTLERHGLPFDQRFVSTFEDGGNTIAGRWEKRDADRGLWELDFELTYRRAG